MRDGLYLALDTATDRPTLALGTSAAPGKDAVIAHRHDLSREIDRVARGLLEARDVPPSALAGIAVADGPGSFTGLRIGIAFAKGMCRALGVPLLAAPSLLGAARAVASAGVVVAEYDALRGEVYRGVYRFLPEGVEVLAPPAVVPREPAYASAEPWVRAADGDASAAALLGLVGVRGGAVAVPDPASWEPAYGRLAEAEARRRAARAPHG